MVEICSLLAVQYEATKNANINKQINEDGINTQINLIK